MNLLNIANSSLIFLKQSASSALDYRPISLMHNAAKILGKLMATILAPKHSNVINTSQNALVKKIYP
jgi:hypothetical protein